MYRTIIQVHFQVQRMLSNIKNSFESLVSTLSWMDLPTKRATVEKVRSMKSLIGFPEWLFEPGKLEEYYEGMVTDPKMHLENQLNLLELGFNNKIKNFRKPYEFGWDTIPTEVNAYHTFQANTISKISILIYSNLRTISQLKNETIASM